MVGYTDIPPGDSIYFSEGHDERRPDFRDIRPSCSTRRMVGLDGAAIVTCPHI